MNSPAKAHEPTMEEILASIRRIISDDDPAAQKPGAAKPAKPAAAPEPAEGAAVRQDDIDAMFAEMDAPAAPKPADAGPVGQDDIDAMFAAMEEPAAAPAPAPPPDFTDDLDVLELTEEMEDKPRPAPEPAMRLASRPASPPMSRPLVPREDLLSAAVGEQVSNAFGSLAHTVLAGNARTLDDIVQEMLRPMLRSWLDDNLPPLVERLVRQEIERVARGGR